LQSLLAREEGQDLVEYGLVTILVAVGAVATLQTVAAPLNALITKAITAVNNAV
jgi:Flp pilus assembly pilin Flp